MLYCRLDKGAQAVQLAVISGTVFGTSEEVAYHAVELLLKAGVEVEYKQHWELDELLAADPRAVLFVCSTTGMGEIPEALQPLVEQLEERLPDWAGRPVGVIALGDSGYGDTYCGAGELLLELSETMAMVELQEMLRLDASETVTQAQDAEPWIQSFAQELLAWESV